MKILKRPRWRWVSIAIVIVVITGGLAAFVWHTLRSPRVEVAQAIDRLLKAETLRMKGSLTVHQNASSPSSANAENKIDFDSQQRGLDSVSNVHIHPAGAEPAMPLSLRTHGAKSYLQLQNLTLFDQLINQASPLEAVKLITQRLVFEQVIKDQWLQYETTAPDTRLAVTPLLRSPLQACAATLFSAADSAQQFIRTAVSNAGVFTFDEKASAQRQVSFKVEPAVFRTIDTAECSAVMDVKPIEVTVWIEGDLVRRLQIAVQTLHERLVIDATVSEEGVDLLEVPTTVISEVEARQRFAELSNSEQLFKEVLARYPHLQTIIDNLQVLDSEQGL